MGKVIILQEYKNEKLENATRLQTDDGKEFVLYPPDLWNVELQSKAVETEDPEDICKLILNGQENFDSFIESGGSPLMLIMIFGELEKYGDLLEADFFQYYNLDIAQMGLPGMSYDRVIRLIGQLPNESRYNLKKMQGLDYEWTIEQYMMAQVIDSLSAIIWQNANANTKPGKQTKKPTPIQRPMDISKPKRPALNSKEMLEALNKQKERLGL
jgi:hypothetical protein